MGQIKKQAAKGKLKPKPVIILSVNGSITPIKWKKLL